VGAEITEVGGAVEEDQGVAQEQCKSETVDVPAIVDAKTRPLEPPLGAGIDQQIAKARVERGVVINGLGDVFDRLGKRRSELPLQIQPVGSQSMVCKPWLFRAGFFTAGNLRCTRALSVR
jgi:hypothetical protein